MAQRPVGTDVSHYQGTINWTNVKNAGVTFAWAKATESTGYTDPYFTTNAMNAKKVGIPIGAYHFARPSSHPNITGASSAVSEANHFWGVISNYVKPGGAYMIPMLDWEDTGMTNQLTAATLSSWVNQFCNTISNYANAAGIPGMKPIVYTGAWYSRPSSKYSGLTTAVTIWPSWIAAYPASPAPQTGGPSDTFPWSGWNFWQYADTNWSGGDSDVFNGTAAGLANYIVGGSGPPSIASNPSHRNTDRGSSISFRIQAGGAIPLKYQWRFNGINISLATNSTLTLTNIQAANGGSYTCVITNSSGIITSSVAKLTINPLFTTVFSDDFETNSSSLWTVNKSSDAAATFAYNYTGMGIPVAPRTTNGTKSGLRLDANLTANKTNAVNLSPVGQIFSGDHRVHFDMWINVNGPFPDGGAGSTQHITAGTGTRGTNVQWNTGTSDGAWFAVDGDGQAGSSNPDIRAMIGTTQQNTNTGFYAAGTGSDARDCSNPYYSNVFPGGQTAPAAQTSAYPQQTGGLDVGTFGMAWHDIVINKTGNNLEWYIDGLKIATMSNLTFSASNVFVGYWDSFASLTDNTNLSFGLVDNFRVEVPVVPPSISNQPQSLLVAQNSKATFTVTADGTPSPNYQWFFNGSAIPNATTNRYTRTNAQMGDAGSYSVVVTNMGGSVTSSTALLMVSTPPAITTSPTGRTVNVGANTTFNVEANGTAPLIYQWRFNDSPIGGGTTNSLPLSNVQMSQAGSYSVVISNASGSATSSGAVLSVVQLQSGEATMLNGTFQFSVNGAPGPDYSIEASSNLIDWIPLATWSNSGGSLQFFDGASSNYLQRFYRISAPK